MIQLLMNSDFFVVFGKWNLISQQGKVTSMHHILRGGIPIYDILPIHLNLSHSVCAGGTKCSTILRRYGGFNQSPRDAMDPRFLIFLKSGLRQASRAALTRGILYIYNTPHNKQYEYVKLSIYILRIRT